MQHLLTISFAGSTSDRSIPWSGNLKFNNPLKADRLVEISPPIPQKIIDEFNSKMNQDEIHKWFNNLKDILIYNRDLIYKKGQNYDDNLQNILSQIFKLFEIVRIFQIFKMK